MAHRRRHITALCAAALVLGVSACSGGSDDKAADGAPTSDSTPETSATTSSDSGDLPDGFGPGPAGSGMQRFYDQDVTWNSCTQGECADVWVPLDYSDPDGQAITIVMAKQEATGSDKLGTMFINPGGPGVSGVDFVSGNPLDDELKSHYDVVGFDPRGVGQSTPVDCVSDSELDTFVASEPSPQTQAEIDEFESEWSTYVDGCQQRSGPLLPHLSTVDVANDLDVLRTLVGDDKLNYFGFSYGTYIGATYAGLFPDKVGRMVLDGAIDPNEDPLKSELGQTKGFEGALDDYLQDCVDQGSCPLGDSVAAGKQTISDLLASIDKHPLPTSSGRDLTLGLAFYGIIFPLYSQDTWPFETQALQAALGGSGDVLLAIADAYGGRGADGTYADNRLEVQSPVNCLDTPQSESVDQILAGAPKFERAAPVFGSVGAWFPYACSNWPVKADAPKPDFSAKGAAPIVVVGTTRDPATPYAAAVALANILDSGVLITRHGDGHTGYGKGSACVDTAVDTYFVKGTPPADGLSC